MLHQYRHSLRTVLTACLAITLAAVAWGGVAAAPPARPAAAATPSPTPDTEALAAQLIADLGTGQPSGYSGVAVQPLRPLTPDQPLWSAHTLGGINPFDHRHVLAVYTYAGGNWQQLDRVLLGCSEIMQSDSVRQVDVTAYHFWLEVRAYAGAHSECYHVFKFDGHTLQLEAHDATSTPGRSRLQDVDGDATLELVLDHSEPYVLCYACGVINPDVWLLRWDGQRFREVTLTFLPEAAPPRVRDANNLAVRLAMAHAWQAAAEWVQYATDLAPDNETVRWNRALINLNRDAASGGGLPLFGELMRGDYAAIVTGMRAYPLDELFGPGQGPLAEVDFAWQNVYLFWLIHRAEMALEWLPDYAVAHFLRGWALYRGDPGNPEAVREVLRAAELQPDEPLFVASAALLTARHRPPTAE